MKHFFFARFLFCAFFTVLFFANAPAQDCNSYPDCLDKGLNALKTRNASKAKDYFKDAKKYARKGDDKGNKDEAKSLREVADDYGDDYFKELSKSADYQKSRNFKNLVMLYQASIQKFERINRRDVADLLKPVDEQLRKTHNEEAQKFEKTRKDEVEKAFQSGQKLLSVSPTEAITQLEWLKTQAYPNEIQQMKVDALLTDAYYNSDLQRGKHEASSGDLEKALATYQKAQNRKNTPEATTLVKETRSLIYQKHFKAGNDQALAKQYEKAHKSFLKSKEYTDDATEVNSRINYWYENLYSEGQKAYTAEKYQEALNIYKNAAIFDNSTQLQTAQKEANHGLQLKSARDLMAKGEVNNAIQATDRALGFVKSQEAADLKTRLNNHLALLQTAEQQFSSGNMAEAANSVAKARELVPVSNNAYSVQQKIESYNKSMEQAQQLKKSDPLRALPFARAAQNLSNNPQVQQLITEINQNMHTTVTLTLQGYANCSPDGGSVCVKKIGVNGGCYIHKQFQSGGVSITITEQGDYVATLEGLKCPQPQAKQPSDTRVGVNVSAITATPSVRFSCKGGQVRAILQ